MKKLLCISGVLIIIDQITKHIARHFVGDGLIEIIPGVLGIAPFHNTYLGWLGWLGGIVEESSPFILIFLKHLFFLILLVVAYKYFYFISQKSRVLLNASLAAGIAGMGGSFIDNLLFNGSWDFIFLFNALILDLKDFYILTQITLLNIFGIMLIPQCMKLNKEQRNKLKFSSWFKSLLPISHFPRRNLLTKKAR